MTYKHFWELVDNSCTASEGDDARQRECLAAALMELPGEEIAEFDAIRESLSWLAHEVAEAGCHPLGAVRDHVDSEEGWLDWRAWLISQGFEAYFAALMGRVVDLQRVVNLRRGMNFKELAAQSNEAFMYVPAETLERKFGPGAAWDYLEH